MAEICGWAGPEEIYIKYHDIEWGIPEYDGRLLRQMPGPGKNWRRASDFPTSFGLPWVDELFRITGIIKVMFPPRQLFHFPPNGLKPPASSRSASANLSLIFSPEF